MSLRQCLRLKWQDNLSRHDCLHAWLVLVHLDFTSVATPCQRIQVVALAQSLARVLLYEPHKHRVRVSCYTVLCAVAVTCGILCTVDTLICRWCHFQVLEENTGPTISATRLVASLHGSAVVVVVAVAAVPCLA